MGKHHPKRTGGNGFLKEFSSVIRTIEATQGVSRIKALKKTMKETPFIDKAVSKSHVDGRQIIILLVATKYRQKVIVHTDNPKELLDRIPDLNRDMINKPSFARTL